MERPDGDRQAVSVAAGRVGKGLVLHLSRDRAPRSTPQAHRAGRPWAAPRGGSAAIRPSGRRPDRSNSSPAQVHARPVGRALHLLRQRQPDRRAVQRPEGKFGMHLVDARPSRSGRGRAAARRSRGSWGRWQSPAATLFATGPRWRRRWRRPPGIIRGLDGAAAREWRRCKTARSAEERTGSAAPAPGPSLQCAPAGRWACRRRSTAGRSRRIGDGGKGRRRHDAVDLRIVDPA